MGQFHSDLTGSELHISKTNVSTGDPNSVVTAGVIGEFYWDSTNNKLYVAEAADNVSWISTEAGTDEFLDMTDTPSSYSGEAGRPVIVNTTPDGLEFSDLATLTSTFLTLEPSTSVDSGIIFNNSSSVESFKLIQEPGGLILLQSDIGNIVIKTTSVTGDVDIIAGLDFELTAENQILFTSTVGDINLDSGFDIDIDAADALDLECLNQLHVNSRDGLLILDGHANILLQSATGIVTSSTKISITGDTDSTSLSLDTTTGALRLPRLSTIERDALTPLSAFTIFNTDTLQVEDYNGTSWVGATEADEFLELSDTPSSYSGQGGLAVQVNAGETGLEFGQAVDTTDSPTFAAVNTPSIIDATDITLTTAEVILTTPLVILQPATDVDSGIEFRNSSGVEKLRLEYDTSGDVINVTSPVSLRFDSTDSAAEITFFAGALLTFDGPTGINFTSSAGIVDITANGNIDLSSSTGIITSDSDIDITTSTNSYKMGGTTILFEDATDLNLSVGFGVGLAYTTGTKNIGVGRDVLAVTTTGELNTGLGYNALLVNVDGSENVAIGADALGSNTSGNRNTAVGVSSLLSNTVGTENTAVGNLALSINSSGINNTAVGNEAMLLNTSGEFNVAVGDRALAANTSGEFNTAFGADALEVNTTGIENTAVGCLALADNVFGRRNTAIGEVAGRDIATSGLTGENTVIGYNTGRGITTGVQNTVIGANVTGLSNPSNNIILADGAGVIRLQFDSAGDGIIGGNLDVDALTATSYGGILEANLLDKSSTEAVSGDWVFTNDVQFTGGLFDFNQFSGTAGQILSSTGTQIEWVDINFGALSWKTSVLAATTTAGTLATDFENGDTLDGIVLSTDDRILIKDQATGSENGIYLVRIGGAPTRTTDFDEDADVPGAVVLVREGTTNESTTWKLTNTGTIIVDTTALTFAEFAGTGDVSTSDTLDNLTLIVGAGTKDIQAVDASGTTANMAVNAAFNALIITADLNGGASYQLNNTTGTLKYELLYEDDNDKVIFFSAVDLEMLGNADVLINAEDSFILNSTTGNFTFGVDINSTTAYKFQNSANTNVLAIDTTNDKVIVTGGLDVESPDADTVALLELTTTGTNGGTSSTFVGDQDPDGIITGAGGDEYIRDDADQSGTYENLEATTGTNWFKRSINPSTVIEINTLAQLDALASGGTITISTNTTLVIKAALTTGNVFVVEDGIDLHINGSFQTDSSLTYSGTGTFFTGTLGAGLRIGERCFIQSSSTGTLLDWAGSFQLRNTSIVGWSSLGTFDGLNTLIFDKIGFISVTSGLNIIDPSLVFIVGIFQFGATLSGALFTIENNDPDAFIRFDAIIATALTATGSLFDLSTKMNNDAAITITNSDIVGLGDLFKQSTLTDATFTAVADSSPATGNIDSSVSNGDGGTTINITTLEYFEDEEVTISNATASDGTYQIFNVVANISFDIIREFTVSDTVGDVDSERIVVTLDTGHGMSSGDAMKINESNFYNGFYTALDFPTTDTLTLNQTFVDTDTGSIERELSLDQTDPRVIGITNPGTPDSETIAFGFTNNNEDDMVITQSDYLAIEAATFVSNSDITERFKLTDSTAVIYELTAKEDFKGFLRGGLTAMIGSGTQNYRFAMSTNGVVPDFDDTAVSATVVDGGSGYAVNDTLTLVGGTSLEDATFNVDTVSSGAVTSVSLTDGGEYTVQPSNPVATTGPGTGATLTVVFVDGANYIPMEVKTTAVNIALAFSVDLTEGDTIQIMVAGDGTSANLTITDLVFGIQ